MRNLRKNLIKEFIRDRGGYFGIVGAISITISALISFLLHSSVNPSFNIISYVVSDLGTGPKISSLVYNIGMIISSYCQIALYISLLNYLHKKEGNAFLIKITALSSFFSIIGHIILSLVPFERKVLLLFLTHGTSASIHYVAGSIAFIFYGFIELLKVKVSKILVIISFITGVLYSMLWIGYLLYFAVGIPEECINNTIQWIAFAGIILWSLLHGIFLIKAKKRDLNNTKF